MLAILHWPGAHINEALGPSGTTPNPCVDATFSQRLAHSNATVEVFEVQVMHILHGIPGRAPCACASHYPTALGRGSDPSSPPGFLCPPGGHIHGAADVPAQLGEAA